MKIVECAGKTVPSELKLEPSLARFESGLLGSGGSRQDFRNS